MEFNNGKNIFIGINNNGDLVSLELKFNDLNKGTKFYNPHYYLSPHGFSEIIDEEIGKQKAYETLENEDYWEDIGYISKDMPLLLRNHIDFKAVAEEVINTDGWTRTNGEFYYFGTYEDKEYYISLQWCGFDEKAFNRDNYKTLFISEEDFKFLCNNKQVKQEENPKGIKNQLLQEQKIRELKTIFSKYQDTKEIIKAFLESKED